VPFLSSLEATPPICKLSHMCDTDCIEMEQRGDAAYDRAIPRTIPITRS
jgi:hypothetical protein